MSWVVVVTRGCWGSGLFSAFTVEWEVLCSSWDVAVQSIIPKEVGAVAKDREW